MSRITRVFAFFFLTASFGATSRSHGGESQKIKPSILAFGDSVMAGYSRSGDLRRTKSDFVSIVGSAVRSRIGLADFQVWNLAVPGLNTENIKRAFMKLQTLRQREAEVLLMNGGGNNALPFRRLPLATLCDERTYEPFVSSMTSDWISMLNILRSRRDPHRPTIVLGLYYPVVNESNGKRCGERLLTEIFLPYLAESNYRLYHLARRDRLNWVDLMPLMNCPAAFRSHCAILDTESLEQYQSKLLRLLRTGVFRDPSFVEGGLIQDDNVHPNAKGHRLIAEHVLEALGF